MSMITFALSYFIHAGDVWSFALVCICCGMTFGADLALPPSMLADAVDTESSDDHIATGAYFGIWSVTAKMATGLAAGIAFPVLAWLGYKSGGDTLTSTASLSAMFAFFPVGIKAITAFTLYISPLDQGLKVISGPLEAKTV